ncbi:sulfite exporter TauE/SafE family protein [Bacillus tianshenii]|nr:sulfite exporter TauE/SafE family protein [Bacillus tianshenii]
MGSVAGVGGGVIIKPTLDVLSSYDVSSISALSSATVFAMAVMSLIKTFYRKVKIEYTISLFLALGSVIGGILGKTTFNQIVSSASSKDIVTVIQAGTLAVLLIFVLLFVKNKQKMKTFKIRNKATILLVGFLLGTFSSFLGIGGGPFNVAILMWFFSLNTKDSAINSIFIIFFSQLSTLVTISFSPGFGQLNLSMMTYMIVGGLLGGLLGSALSKKIDDQQVEKIFNLTLVLIIGINLYTIFSKVS